MQKLIRTRGIVIRVVVYGGLVAFILYLAFRPNIHDRAWFNVSRMDIFSFVTAMESYKDAYGTYPTGDNPTVFGALRGNNPKKLIFLDVHPRSISADGAFVDPWQTPYEITIRSTNSVSIRSAGKNKRFGDADDVTNSP
jgi:hypothetical protein